MASKRNKIIIGLIVIIVISLFLAFVFSNLIASNACRDIPDINCHNRIFFQWFFPTLGLSFLALIGCLGLALLRIKLD